MLSPTRQIPSPNNSGAKHIIAVNTDPAAPMMTRADYAVIGDLHEVVPALIEGLRARNPEQAG